MSVPNKEWDDHPTFSQVRLSSTYRAFAFNYLDNWQGSSRFSVSAYLRVTKTLQQKQKKRS